MALIPFGGFKSCIIAFGLLIYCVNQNYVIASYVYRIAPTSGPHDSRSNSPDFNQAVKLYPCSEPPEFRKSQGVQSNIAVLSHSDSSLMDSKSSESRKNPGSNPEPSYPIRQSQVKSETYNTNLSNVGGNHHPMQHDSNIDLNATPVREKCETNPAFAQFKTKVTSDNATHNDVSESIQLKVDNITPTVDLSSPHSRPTLPAAPKSGAPQIRNRLNVRRSFPTLMSPRSLPIPTTDVKQSPTGSRISSSHSSEIEQAKHTDPVTLFEPRNSSVTHSTTVLDPSRASSLERDEEGPELIGSGLAPEPTYQGIHPHMDPETKAIGHSDSEPSVK